MILVTSMVSFDISDNLFSSMTDLISFQSLGVLDVPVFIEAMEGPGAEKVGYSKKSLIVSILSAGTFIGALVAGEIADRLGRRMTIITGCVIYIIGVIVQMFAAEGLAAIVVGRVVAGLGVGFVSAIIILYMSEIAPRKVRGAIVAGYQFCVTIGLMLASIVARYTKDRTDSGSYRIVIGLQFVFGLILGGGLFFLPDSPRFYVMKGNIPAARGVLSRLRGQPETDPLIEDELAEIIANHEYEVSMMPSTTFWGKWFACFTGSVFDSTSNLRRTILGTSLQMMQQWTGVNFIFYYSTTFLSSTGAIEDPFLMSMIFTIVNVGSTPLSFWTVERFGRRALLIIGAGGMLICQFIVAIVGVTVGFNKLEKNPDGSIFEDVNGNPRAENIQAVNAQIAFIAIFIFFFASTWGPGAWVLIGEIFPIPIRSKGVALSTASNWLWNTIIAVITPYMTDSDKGNLRSSVFFVWGGLCSAAFVYAIFIVPETKGLSLEEVDQMFAQTTPLKSASWKPTRTFTDLVHGDENIAEHGIISEKDSDKQREAIHHDELPHKSTL